MYDHPPKSPRSPLHVAGELALRGDPLSIEAAKVIRDLVRPRECQATPPFEPILRTDEPPHVVVGVNLN